MEKIEARAAAIESIGIAILRYGVVFLLGFIGALKFFAFEAQAIQPLVANSPFLGWTYRVLSVQGVSSAIGTAEIVTALLIASRRFAPALSAIGSAAGTLTFLTTLSFLFSTPGALSPMHPAWGFLVKDVVLLGACVATAGEALRAAQAHGRAAMHGAPAVASA